MDSRSKIKDIHQPSSDAVGSRLLQRKCACGKVAGLSGECEECQAKQLTTQRQPVNAATESRIPASAEEVVRSEGKPLDPQTRGQMESRLGHDFSNVRIHVDEQANASASALGASAYTVSDHIVFAAGKYDAGSKEGAERLAHELTHVVQQRLNPNQGSSPSTKHEAEAQDVGASVASGGSSQVTAAASAGSIQLDKDKNPLDEKAKKIIAIAKDESKKPEERTVAIATAIIDTYYASDKKLVDSVVFNNEKAGTGAHAEQKFSKTSKPEESTGIIYIGDVFLKGVTESGFARRVMQIGHEIEHIHQWREGLAGGHKQFEREFLAFYHEALLPEKPGTGRINDPTRLSLIDEALENYFCLSSEKQTEHAGKKKELSAQRASIISGGTKAKKDEPKSCTKK
jgi:hypothetical protein